jgi:hypothetical protein
MGRWIREEHGEFGGLDPDERDDDADHFDDDCALGDEDDDLCMPCPHCGHKILEESERCPHCERYLSREDTPPARKPLWIWVGVIACLYVVYRWIVW